MISIFMV